MSGGRPKGPHAPEGFDELADQAAGEVPDDGGMLAPNPELEAAMREALEGIPDGGDAIRREPEPQAPPAPRAAQAPQGGQGSGSQGPKDDEELVLANPIERAPHEEAHRLQVELTDTRDKLLRLQADFENFRRRAAREHQEALLYGPQNVVKDLLSVVDNLDRAVDHARQSEGGDLQGLLQGVELVQRELLSVLEKHHVTEIEALGKPFDPAFHEAMAQVAEDSVAPNTVIEVLQKGYQLRDRLLRPAQVVVTKGAPAADDGQGETAG
ncbi:MAG: nucleotide exchange factor GrpE [Myxococcota bacterium]